MLQNATNSLSVFYYNGVINSMKYCDNGSMCHIGMDEDFLLFENGRAQINPSVVADLGNRIHVLYDSLSEHISGLYLVDEIIQSGRFIVAYDGVDYCDVLRYVIEIFGKIPKNARIVKKNHLVAFYCGANLMYYGLGNASVYTSVEWNGQKCIIDAAERVVEFCDNEYEELVSYDIVLRSKSNWELLAGAMLLHGIWWNAEGYNFIMLDSIPFEISLGIFAKCQSVVVDKDTTIPCRKVLEIEKGYADQLYVTIAGETFVYPIDSCFKKDIRIQASIDVVDGVLVIEIYSQDHSGRDRITMDRLLTRNY